MKPDIFAAAKTKSSKPGQPSVTKRKVKSWLVNQALPKWADAGWDHCHGGFTERLDIDGTPLLSVPKRLVVQARQIYVYAHAHLLNLYPDALMVAEGGVHLMKKLYWSRDGAPGWCHLVDADGSVADPRRDAYDYAFVLFALAWYVRASGDAEALDLLQRTIDCAEADLAADNGGWLEDTARTLPRRQNPHMHLLEAWLAVYETTGDTGFLTRATEIFELFRTRFFDQATGRLLEYFDADWRPVPPDRQRIEPGHMMEWSWLVSRFAALTGRDVLGYAATLYEKGVEIGLSACRPLLIDEIDGYGTVTKPTHRCWPQTEFIKAALARYLATGQSEFADTAQRTLDALFETYLNNGVSGAWRDKIDPQGKPLDSFIPASSFYHLFCALTYAMENLPSRAPA